MEILFGFLSAFFTALPFAIVIFSALAICVFSIWFINSPAAAIGLMTVIFLIETASLTPLALKLGIWIYLPDFLILLLLPGFCYRLLALRKFDSIPLAWWILGLVQMTSFAWGLASYGTGAGVDFRPHFYVWLGAAYLATFDYDEAWARRFLKYFLIIGVGVCAIAYYRWIMGELDYELHRELMSFDATGVGFQRVVAAGPMFITACAMLAAAYLAMMNRSRPLLWVLVPLFGITILAMQHRSVWMAAFAGTIALVWALGRIRSGVGSKFLSMALLGGVLLVVIVASGKFGGAVESVQEQAMRATSTTSGTFVGRVAGWQSLLSTWAGSRSPATYLIGKPFGSGYERYEGSALGGKKVGYMPHNYYVHLLYRGGLISLFAYLWMIGQGLKVLISNIQNKRDSFAPLLFAMLVAQLVYYIPYAIDYAQMILIGLVLGAISRERRSRKNMGQSVPASATPITSTLQMTR